ncbi:MAG TPA: alanine--tRNA ligase [Bacillales bacterium]|nr:alanine--tRNA ligase [Bacillales bacterium]
MKQLTSAQVRQRFLDFFKEKGHRVEPSASLVPVNDPSLLWINSGVATLKKYFDGREVPANPRIVNAQKAIRTNDIENVGKTARHHTFFEMLGNFSIGDYFKKEAIEWAWEFLTDEKWIGFDPALLSVTVHVDDDEAFNLWHENVGLPKERIIKLDEENFWDIGEGPCGPNSEIFYDRGPAYGDDPNDPELYPGGENERYLEVWNLVFSQYNHNQDGSYTPLPKKNIDTGMGLERMVSVIQEGRTNFDTDLFLPIIRKTEKLSGVRYGETQEMDTAFKVIADHIRTVAFAISDGALPSNEGRGYVLRRLLRRAVRFGKTLGLDRPFMHELVSTVAEIMVDFYPEVKEKASYIAKVIEKEEERFHATINEGLSILKDMIERHRAEGSNRLSGQEAFKLYDTYGFPFELTEEYAGDEGVQVDREGFDAELEAQRQRARSARDVGESMQVQGGVLADVHVKSEFVGYDQLETDATVTVIVRNGERVEAAEEGSEVQLMLDRTPFYAESGGEVADQGTIAGDDVLLTVQDVQKAPNGQHLHRVKVSKGVLREGTLVKASVNKRERAAITKNHTATHLLHQALKDVIGSEANQAGSLVAPDRLRFDFSHYRQVSEEELDQIEAVVNEKIWDRLPVDTMQKPLEEAKAMGAMALFGEKYGDVVRIVKAGDYSIELCGGCHVRNTADIGLFKITMETGIGAGTRRIEAVTGKAAYDYMNERNQMLRESARLLRTSAAKVPERIEALREQIRDLERENESLAAKLGHLEATKFAADAKEIDGIRVIAKKVDVADMNQMRTMVDELKSNIGSGIVVLGAVNGGKVNLTAGVTKDLTEKGYHAGKLIKETASRCGGGGGGRPDMAQAGGKDPSKLDEALRSVYDWVKSVS